jgi:hypothetical protein
MTRSTSRFKSIPRELTTSCHGISADRFWSRCGRLRAVAVRQLAQPAPASELELLAAPSAAEAHSRFCRVCDACRSSHAAL